MEILSNTHAFRDCPRARVFGSFLGVFEPIYSRYHLDFYLLLLSLIKKNVPAEEQHEIMDSANASITADIALKSVRSALSTIGKSSYDFQFRHLVDHIVTTHGVLRRTRIIEEMVVNVDVLLEIVLKEYDSIIRGRAMKLRQQLPPLFVGTARGNELSMDILRTLEKPLEYLNPKFTTAKLLSCVEKVAGSERVNKHHVVSCFIKYTGPLALLSNTQPIEELSLDIFHWNCVSHCPSLLQEMQSQQRLLRNASMQSLNSDKE